MEPQSQPVTSDMMQPQVGQIITSNPLQFPAPITYIGEIKVTSDKKMPPDFMTNSIRANLMDFRIGRLNFNNKM